MSTLVIQDLHVEIEGKELVPLGIEGGFLRRRLDYCRAYRNDAVRVGEEGRRCMFLDYSFRAAREKSVRAAELYSL